MWLLDGLTSTRSFSRRRDLGCRCHSKMVTSSRRLIHCELIFKLRCPCDEHIGDLAEGAPRGCLASLGTHFTDLFAHRSSFLLMMSLAHPHLTPTRNPPGHNEDAFFSCRSCEVQIRVQFEISCKRSGSERLYVKSEVASNPKAFQQF